VAGHDPEHVGPTHREREAGQVADVVGAVWALDDRGRHGLHGDLGRQAGDALPRPVGSALAGLALFALVVVGLGFLAAPAAGDIWLSGDLAATGFVATSSTASDHRGIAATVQ
jgi:hypothetical protein